MICIREISPWAPNFHKTEALFISPPFNLMKQHLFPLYRLSLKNILASTTFMESYKARMDRTVLKLLLSHSLYHGNCQRSYSQYFCKDRHFQELRPEPLVNFDDVQVLDKNTSSYLQKLCSLFILQLVHICRSINYNWPLWTYKNDIIERISFHVNRFKNTENRRHWNELVLCGEAINITSIFSMI